MGAKQEAQEWTDIVRRYGERHELTYEPVDISQIPPRPRRYDAAK